MTKTDLPALINRGKPASNNVRLTRGTTTVLLVILGVVPSVFGQESKKISLASVFGKNETAFSRALATKLSQNVEEVPDMVPGKNYSDQERDALPKIKSYRWTAKVASLGTVILMRTEKMKFVTFASFAFQSTTVSTVKLALSKLGLPSAGVQPKKISHGGYSFSLKAGGMTWPAYFYPKDPEVGNKPFLFISDPS